METICPFRRECVGEGNDAEDGIDVYDRDAMLAVDNEASDLDALQDAAEIIESLPKRRGASVGVGREFADGIWMKGKSGRVVVAHRMDVLFNDLDHLFAHEAFRNIANAITSMRAR